MLVTLLPINKKIGIDINGNLLEIASNNGIDLGGICKGNKTCGKCRVLISKGNNHDYAKEELIALTDEERNAGVRLACCYTVKEDTCVILSSNQIDDKTKQIIKEKMESKYFKKYKDDSKAIKINQNANNTVYGVSFDIGTTSVVAKLWDLNNKICYGEISTLNPQSLYGADVISRITYADKSKENLDRLTQLIRNCCNDLIEKISTKNGVPIDNIISVVIAANTTMSHLFLGRSVHNLSKVPFQNVSYEGVKGKADEFDIRINNEGVIFVMPGIGGHVGSDTLGCILSGNLYLTNETILMVDIGTNGELVFVKNGKITACSTAAGPAFEGAAIQHGMRAIEGAIYGVEIKNNKINIDVIGYNTDPIGHKTEPIGICGSGIIEAISEFHKNGMMDDTGRLLGEYSNTNFVTLCKNSSNQIILTQKDIRELQLAKSAIFTGIMLLLKEENIELSEIDKFYLAGAFGNNINLDKAIHIGLLPNLDKEKYKNLGNGALFGADKILLGEISIDQAEQISKSVEHMELAVREDFEKYFINNLNFGSGDMK